MGWELKDLDGMPALDNFVSAHIRTTLEEDAAFVLRE